MAESVGSLGAQDDQGTHALWTFLTAISGVAAPIPGSVGHMRQLLGIRQDIVRSAFTQVEGGLLRAFLWTQITGASPLAS